MKRPLPAAPPPSGRPAGSNRVLRPAGGAARGPAGWRAARCVQPRLSRFRRVRPDRRRIGLSWAVPPHRVKAALTVSGRDCRRRHPPAAPASFTFYRRCRLAALHFHSLTSAAAPASGDSLPRAAGGRGARCLSGDAVTAAAAPPRRHGDPGTDCSTRVCHYMHRAHFYGRPRMTYERTRF